MRTNDISKSRNTSNFEDSSGLSVACGIVHGASYRWTAGHRNRLIEGRQPVIDAVYSAALKLRRIECYNIDIYFSNVEHLHLVEPHPSLRLGNRILVLDTCAAYSSSSWLKALRYCSSIRSH